MHILIFSRSSLNNGLVACWVIERTYGRLVLFFKLYMFKTLFHEYHPVWIQIRRSNLSPKILQMVSTDVKSCYCLVKLSYCKHKNAAIVNGLIIYLLFLPAFLTVIVIVILLIKIIGQNIYSTKRLRKSQKAMQHKHTIANNYSFIYLFRYMSSVEQNVYFSLLVPIPLLWHSVK